MSDSNAVSGDQVDLGPLLGAVVRGWKWIVLATVIGAGVASIDVFRAKPAYEVHATMTLGRTGEGTSLANAADVVGVIQRGVFAESIVGCVSGYSPGEVQRLTRSVDAESTRAGEMVHLSVRSGDKKLGELVLTALVAEIQKANDPRMVNLREGFRADMKKLEQGIALLMAEGKKVDVDLNAQRRLRATAVAMESSGASLLMGKADILSGSIKELEARAASLRLEKDALWAFLTRVEKTGQAINHSADRLVTQAATQPAGSADQALLAGAGQIWATVSQAYGFVKDYDVAITSIHSEITRQNVRAQVARGDAEKLRLESQDKINLCDQQIQLFELRRETDIPARIGQMEADIDRLKAKSALVEEVQLVAPPTGSLASSGPQLRTQLLVGGFCGFLAGCVLAAVVGMGRRISA